MRCANRYILMRYAPLFVFTQLRSEIFTKLSLSVFVDFYKNGGIRVFQEQKAPVIKTFFGKQRVNVMYEQPTTYLSTSRVASTIPFSDPLSRSILPLQPQTITSDIQALTRSAFVEVNGFQPEAMRQLSQQHIAVFNAVAKGLQRAMMNSQFACLPPQQQRLAAIRLVQQCQQGLAMANALQQVLDNNRALEQQLLANAAIDTAAAIAPTTNGASTSSVFDRIVLAYLPTSQLSSPANAMEYYGRVNYSGPEIGH